MEEKRTLYINLGHIGGNKADKLQALFAGYTSKPNEHGYFLYFEEYSHIGNLGVTAITNCFESEEHFTETLFTKLLFNL